MIKGIIFDFDGVITDSEIVFLKGTLAFLNNKGIKSNIDELKCLIGKTDLSIAKTIKEKYALSNLSLNDILLEMQDSYEKLYKLTKPIPMIGLLDFIHECRSKNISIAIASSSGYDYVVNVLDAFRIKECFSIILTGDAFRGKSKPSPDIYIEAAKLLRLTTSELIVIEDSYNGIKAGKAAGIYTIGYKGSVIDQNTTEADLEVNSFSEIDIQKIERRSVVKCG